MEILLLTLITLFAVHSKAQVRAEFELKITPTVTIERSYQEKHTERQGSQWVEVTDHKKEILTEALSEQTAALTAYGQDAKQKLVFQSHKGALPRSAPADFFAEVLAIISAQEVGSASILKLTVQSAEHRLESPYTPTLNPGLVILGPEESFRYLSVKYKVSGVLKIQYFVPANTRLLQVTSSPVENLLAQSKTLGFDNTLSEDVEQLVDANRYVYVMPGTPIEQVIEIPEQEIASAKDLQVQYQMTIARDLHNGGGK